MTQEILLTTIGQIPKGEGRTFEVAGQRVAVFHTHHGEIFAVQAYCPHRYGPLADGLLGGASVVCPLHDWTFDLRTGCGLSHDRVPIETYPVRVSDHGRIWIIPKPAGNSDGARAPGEGGTQLQESLAACAPSRAGNRI